MEPIKKLKLIELSLTINNKPEFTVRDNGKETCPVEQIAISVDRNYIKKEPEKFL
jgi:hypothetical protein